MNNSLLTSSDTLRNVVARLIELMDKLVWPLIGIAILCFFYGLIRYIYKAGDSKGREMGRQTIIWGLIGFFVIFSLWGILHLASDTLFPNSTSWNQRPIYQQW